LLNKKKINTYLNKDNEDIYNILKNNKYSKLYIYFHLWSHSRFV